MLLIAEVYLVPPQSFSMQSAPGSRIDFRSGYAKIFRETDIPFILRMPNAVLKPDPRYYDHVGPWITKCGENNPARCKIDMHNLVLDAANFVATPGDVADDPFPEPTLPASKSGWAWEPVEPEPDIIRAYADRLAAEQVSRPRGRPRKEIPDVTSPVQEVRQGA